MKHSPKAAALLLSPHLDDAVLSCWLLLTDRKLDLVVVNVLAGEPRAGYRGAADQECLRFPAVRALFGDDWDSRQVVAQRRREDRAALGSTGRDVVDLDLLDGQYRDVAGKQDFEEFSQQLESHVGECSTIYLPLGAHTTWMAGHPDHLVTAEWGRRLAGQEIPICTYADLPYALRDGDGEWIGELGMRQRYELTPPQQEEKLAALEKYASQWPLLCQVWQNEAGIELGAPDAWRFEAWEPAGDGSL